MIEQFLPGTGRGTMQRMLEGHGRPLPTFEVLMTRTCPSTPAFGGGPRPRFGEDP
jgi:hypothetical protein